MHQRRFNWCWKFNLRDGQKHGHNLAYHHTQANTVEVPYAHTEVRWNGRLGFRDIESRLLNDSHVFNRRLISLEFSKHFLSNYTIFRHYWWKFLLIYQQKTQNLWFSVDKVWRKSLIKFKTFEFWNFWNFAMHFFLWQFFVFLRFRFVTCSMMMHFVPEKKVFFSCKWLSSCNRRNISNCKILKREMKLKFCVILVVSFACEW